MKKASLILCSIFVLMFTLSACSNDGTENTSQNMPSTAPVNVELTTNNGSIVGLSSNGVATFKGIPYAKPPVGELRFAPPEDVEPWTETLNCENFGPTAMQAWPVNDQPMSEDCLTLNVWKPADTKEGDNLPVYVFIHGGGFAIGTSAEPDYDGTSLAQNGIVYVSINYRLGALGFFASQETYDKYGTTGNWWLLDQIKALEWIKANIEAFGGDPNNVTIGGESAGSFSVSALMLSPLAKDLFQGAIMESGSILTVPTDAYFSRSDLQKSITQSRFLASTFGATSDEDVMEVMQNADAAALTYFTDLEKNTTTTVPFHLMPVFDGKALPLDPVAALRNGEYNKVRLLYGFNDEEGSIFVGNVNEGTYKMMAVRTFLARNAEAVMAHFPIDAQHTALDRTKEFIKHGLFSVGMKEIADVYAKDGADVYAYYFNYIPAALKNTPLGAHHGCELAFVFNTYATEDKADLTMKDEIHKRWINFIKSGDPNVGLETPSKVNWPKYDSNAAQAIIFQEQMKADVLPCKTDIEFLQGIMFDDVPYYK